MTLLARMLGRPDAPPPVPPPVLPPVLPGAERLPDAPQGRRDRMVAGEREQLVDTLSGKVLHGWLQNRHQTLFPLTVNLRSLGPGQAEALARWVALVALATGTPVALATGTPVALATGTPVALATGTPDGNGPAAAAARTWLGSVGADAETLAVFDAALADLPPLHRAMASVAAGGLAAYAYVAALVVSDPRDPGTEPFLAYVAARLALPPTIIRSAVRRYRR